MNLEDFITFGFSTFGDIISWVLLLSMVAKVTSTVTLLFDYRFHFLKTYAADWIWWVTKLSSLSLCSSALILCKLAGDSLGESVFLTLLIAATILVLWLGYRRIRMIRARPVSTP